jgi:tetratricopeptide (TPR) repeat protein
MKWKGSAAGVFFAATFFAGALLASPARPLPSEPVLPDKIERLYDSGLYRQAVEALQTAVENNPRDASLQYWLGRCFYELRDYSHAMASLERAVALDPNRSEYHDWLGKASGRKAEQTSLLLPFSGLCLARKARHEFEAAVRLGITNLEAQRDLIRYLLNAPGIAGGGSDRADEQIRTLSAVDPIEGQMARAESLATHKQFEQASVEYRKIVDSQPKRIGVWFEIAEYYRDRSDAEGMQQAVEAGAKLDPSDRRLAYYRGVALVLAKRDLAEAERSFRVYLDTVPDSADVPERASAHEWLAKLYELESKPNQAAEEYAYATARNAERAPSANKVY